MNKQINLSKITRLVVVDHTKDGQGRLIDMWQVKVETSFQDDGRTLKLFLTDKEPS